MNRIKTFRVRVMRKVEDWVDVQAEDKLQAESLAYNIPGVISVFGQSAIPGDQPVNSELPVGVREE